MYNTADTHWPLQFILKKLSHWLVVTHTVIPYLMADRLQQHLCV